MTWNRRKFLDTARTAFGWVLVAGVGSGILHLFRREPVPPKSRQPGLQLKHLDGPLRPPGALSETEFRKKCIECSLCAEVCPPKAIRFFPGGGLLGNTPYVVAKERACILCMKCTHVCPTGALTPLAWEDVSKVKMGTAVIDKRTCITYLGIGKCEACYTICPLKEVAIVQKALLKPEVIGMGCVGCGLCEEVCPVETKAIWVEPA